MSEMVRLIGAMAERGLVFAYCDSAKVVFQGVDDDRYLEFKGWDEVAKYAKEGE